MGGDIDEIAADMDIDPSALLKESNWKFKDENDINLAKPIFTYDGQEYTFRFDYLKGGVT